MANFPAFYPPYPNGPGIGPALPSPGLCASGPVCPQQCDGPVPPLQIMSMAPPPICAPPPGCSRQAIPTWTRVDIISNRRNYAPKYDPDLVNPWGIAILDSQLWVVNDGTDSITNYDLYGNRQLGTISVRDMTHNASYPTGIAVNCGSGFSFGVFQNIGRTSRIIVPTQHGTIHAFNPDVDPQMARVVVNPWLGGERAVFKGIALACGRLYVADFFQGEITVFDSNFDRLEGFPFVDGDTVVPIPLDYAPFNIVYIGDFLYVLWARKNSIIPIKASPGDGQGFISKFNLDGSFVCRFHTGGPLNMPWAMIPAPCDCGIPPGSFLVGNHGDGRINVFDCNGTFFGPLLNQGGIPMIIDGLWGLAPYYTPGLSQIYFTASADPNAEGILGIISKHQIIYI